MSFTIIPDWLAKYPDLKLNDKLVYAVLLRFQGKNDAAWPSQKTVALLAMLSLKSARRSIKKLEDLNWIKRVRFGHGKTNRYRCQMADKGLTDPLEKLKGPTDLSCEVSQTGEAPVQGSHRPLLVTNHPDEEKTLQPTTRSEVGWREGFLEKPEPETESQILARRIQEILEDPRQKYLWQPAIDDPAIAEIRLLPETARAFANQGEGMVASLLRQYHAAPGKITSIPAVILYRLKARYADKRD